MNRNWVHESTLYFVIDPDDEEIRSPSKPYMKELFPFYGSQFPFIKGVGEYLPIRNACVDVIIIQDTLDHALLPHSLIHECYRILVSDGTLAIMQDVKDAGTRRSLIQDFSFVLKKKGIKGLIRGSYWKLRERINPSINRHGHINEFCLEDIKSLLSIFPHLEIKEPSIKGFPHLYFLARK